MCIVTTTRNFRIDTRKYKVRHRRDMGSGFLLWYDISMCSTCGCGRPKDKHGEKTIAAANKKYAPKPKAKARKKK